MEIKRKEQNVRMVTKDTQLVESEKRLLHEKLDDAGKAMTGAARFVLNANEDRNKFKLRMKFNSKFRVKSDYEIE
jgi:hypothetical protein